MKAFDSCSHGHHISKTHWCLSIGEALLCQHEEQNQHDPNSVAIFEKTRGAVVGCIPICTGKVGYGLAPRCLHVWWWWHLNDVTISPAMKWPILFWWLLKNPPICQNKLPINISSYMVLMQLNIIKCKGCMLQYWHNRGYLCYNKFWNIVFIYIFQ
jgi:hypothetical protein